MYFTRLKFRLLFSSYSKQVCNPMVVLAFINKTCSQAKRENTQLFATLVILYFIFGAQNFHQIEISFHLLRVRHCLTRESLGRLKLMPSPPRTVQHSNIFQNKIVLQLRLTTGHCKTWLSSLVLTMNQRKLCGRRPLLITCQKGMYNLLWRQS